MEYKNFIKSRKLRLLILNCFSFIPDKFMVMLQYRIKHNRKLELKKPTRFTEKLQWYKLYYRNPLMVQCTDKYEVREYVSSKGLSDILIDLYGVYNNVSEIDFRQLPERFVLKSTNGGGGNNVIVCEDKNQINVNITKEIIKSWKVKRRKSSGREWVYDHLNSRILFEKLLDRDVNGDLIDYKLYCFDGEPYFILVCKDRFSSTGLKKGYFDKEFNFIETELDEYSFLNDKNKRISLSKPKNFERMLEIARILSKDFPHVRVDLYNIDGKIYFGELTFFGASGYNNLGKLDFELGKLFNLPKVNI